ncbi:peptide-methionine (S)-S-oxide reductase MsrA [Glycomyces artemisiae]|uniref:Peptide methionine sulfoxide reductase MsrA n=1 Tax=Glycomyces artemisiae TaxID=1076443 RepID=A0A2T0URI0_9ACTN|nr:peptide-methionine (S)-S-oxide reductase MsrA [Glycomyces artemisiae]PRY60539.1 peptide-methionine (S)-S-oxide reductase [Glycomyces artemisiae]
MSTVHPVLKHPVEGVPGPDAAVAYFGMGCFWGAERLFWRVPGVWTTSVGYMGGNTEKPSYEEVCTGLTGHAEAVRVVYDPAEVDYEDLLKVFWEHHDPTQGMRQGNDIGSQYRSVVYTTTPGQQAAAEASRTAFAPVVAAAGLGAITTAIRPAGPYWLAEEDHQQYLHKHPNGYCDHGPNGLSCPVGVVKARTGVEPPR